MMRRIFDMPELKDKEVLTINQNAMISEAIKKMKLYNCGAIVVLDDKKKLAGIFTERDVLNRVVDTDIDIKHTKVLEVMTSDVKVANKNDSVSDSMRRMSQGRFRHLPIVDDNNNVISIVSQGDFVAYTWGDIAHLFAAKAQSSFFSNFQLWIMIIGILAYTTLVAILFR